MRGIAGRIAEARAIPDFEGTAPETDRHRT
jgi:hypothetical protein